MASSAHIDGTGGRSWRDLLLWTGAFVVVLSTQAAGAYWLMKRPAEELAPQGAPTDAIMLELAPMATTTDQAIADVPPDQQAMIEQEEIAPSEEPVEQAVETPAEPEPLEEPEPVEQPTEEPVEPELVEPEPVVEEPPEEDPPAPEEPQEEPVDAPMEEVVPEVGEAPEPAVVAPLPVQQSARLLEQRQRPRAAPRPPEQKAAPRTAAPPAVEAPKAEVARSANSGVASAPSVSPARWQSQLMSYLNRHKRYPRSSQSRREEGLAQVEFSIDPRGNVLSARVVRSSGFPELDQAALDMISRASPVPAPPPEIAQARMTLNLPVQFDL
ncbi:energy transducer TonB [Devosia sp. RR2S18]|uniref:energy transducer TonB n=1 Tax=Devosia rhizosphaerae TaxID=3049774 RepID=UPI0025415A37|nr:energy transducer TonB [Devosia sp. RR2S18]WIJ23768.1 energy transducer TonB [Devosia sp. RR2S18]